MNDKRKRIPEEHKHTENESETQRQRQVLAMHFELHNAGLRDVHSFIALRCEQQEQYFCLWFSHCIIL